MDFVVPLTCFTVSPARQREGARDAAVASEFVNEIIWVEHHRKLPAASHRFLYPVRVDVTGLTCVMPMCLVEGAAWRQVREGRGAEERTRM